MLHNFFLKQAPEPADQLEAHRKIVSKLSPETIEKSSRRLTTGFQLYKLAKCDENRKTSSKEAYKEAEKKWRQLWNSVRLDITFNVKFKTQP